MYRIRYVNRDGGIITTPPLGSYEEADRWREVLLFDPRVVSAAVVPVDTVPIVSALAASAA